MSATFLIVLLFLCCSLLCSAMMHTLTSHACDSRDECHRMEQLRFDVKLRPARELMMSEVERKINKTFKTR